MKASIEDKIRKLFAKAEGAATDEERATYSEKAQALMTKYAIEQLTEQVDGDGLGEMGVTNLAWRGTFAKQFLMLANVVARYNDCVGVQYKEKRKINDTDTKWGTFLCLQIVGYEEDRKRVDMLRQSLEVQANFGLAAHVTEHADLVSAQDGWTKFVFRRSYLDGFNLGVRKYLRDVTESVTRAAKAENPGAEVALVDKQREVFNAVNALVGPTRRTHGRSTKANGASQSAGFAAGQAAGGSSRSSVTGTRAIGS